MNKMQSAKRYGAAIGSIALYLLISVLYKGEYIYTVLQQICCFFVAVMGINFITGMTGQPMMGAAGVRSLIPSRRRCKQHSARRLFYAWGMLSSCIK